MSLPQKLFPVICILCTYRRLLFLKRSTILNTQQSYSKSLQKDKATATFENEIEETVVLRILSFPTSPRRIFCRACACVSWQRVTFYPHVTRVSQTGLDAKQQPRKERCVKVLLALCGNAKDSSTTSGFENRLVSTKNVVGGYIRNGNRGRQRSLSFWPSENPTSREIASWSPSWSKVAG